MVSCSAKHGLGFFGMGKVFVAVVVVSGLGDTFLVSLEIHSFKFLR